jgi:hypothetical protein
MSSAASVKAEADAGLNESVINRRMPFVGVKVPAIGQ